MTSKLVLTAALITILDASCPPGTIQGEHPDKCYRPFARPRPWKTARDDCNHIGGDLVSVKDSHSNAFLSNMLNDLGTSQDYWLGGMTQKGSWVWSDTSPFNFANWESSKFFGTRYADEKPMRDLQEKQSFCTALNPQSGKWTTVGCRLPKSFLCEVTPNPGK